MAIARVFPMLDGPPIPYELAEVIIRAYQALHGEKRTLASVSERGGFSWSEVPLAFTQLKRRDRQAHDALMRMARNLTLLPAVEINSNLRQEVQAALDGQPGIITVPGQPPIPEPPDRWLLENSGKAVVPPAADEVLTIVCWKWEQSGYRVRFSADQVNILARMIKRNYKKPCQLICITDDPKGIKEMDTIPIWDDHERVPNPSGKHLPSCYRRLKIFDPKVAEELGATRILSIDLDVVITGDVSMIFDRPDPFVGWKVPGVFVPEVYNGSMFMFTPGHYSWIWETFDPVKSPILAKQAGYQGSDQAWLSYCLKAREPGWGKHDGVYSYPRDVRTVMGLPAQARIVIFHGARKPWDSRHSRDRQWIMKHYK